MTSPSPRPTREQVDAALARAEQYRPGPRDLLAAEVRALRADVERLRARTHEIQAQEMAKRAHLDSLIDQMRARWDAAKRWTEDNELLAEWASGTGRSSPFWSMTSMNSRDALARLIGERDDARAELAGVEGERDAADDFAASVRELLDVSDEPGWGRQVHERIRVLLAARTPQPAEEEDLVGDVIEAWTGDRHSKGETLRSLARLTLRGLARRGRLAAAPQPAVPDGEDATAVCPVCGRTAALVLDAHGHFGPDVEAEDEVVCDVSHWRLSWAAEKAAGGRPDTRSSLPVVDGEDVAARLEAAAGAADQFGAEHLAKVLWEASAELGNEDTVPELRAAVAAALARPADRCTPGHCDRCIPGPTGEHIDVHTAGQLPCVHTGGDA